MNGSPLLTPHVLRQIAVLLALGFAMLGAWCLGRLRSHLRPQYPLVGAITQHRFTEHMQQRGIERRIAATVYRYLREVQSVAVPMLPGDHLVWDLGLDEARLEQTLTDLARRLERHLPSAAVSRLPGTVGDLAVMLQRMPGQNAHARQAA